MGFDRIDARRGGDSHGHFSDICTGNETEVESNLYRKRNDTKNEPKMRGGIEMNRKRKIGILLMLIGIGIPLVTFFFQKDGQVFKVNYERTSKLETLAPLFEVRTVLALVEIRKYSKELSKRKSIMTVEEYGTTGMYGAVVWNIDQLFSLWSIEQAETGEIIFPDGSRIDPESDVANKIGTFTTEYNLPKDLRTYAIKIPFRFCAGFGVLLWLTGVGFYIFSLFPQVQKALSSKPNNKETSSKNEHLQE